MNFKDEYMYEYIRLDNLCKDLFDSNKGISTYIERLENLKGYGYKEDLKKLKRYRHIRNQIAHETNPDEINMCDYSDIDWIHDFYQNILRQSDPLALEYKRNMIDEKTKPTTHIPANKEYEKKSVMIAIFIALILFAISLFLFCMAI